MSERKEQIDGRFGQLATDIYKIAKNEYLDALRRSGQADSKIREDINRGILQFSKDLYAEINFGFDKHGRWRDLKYVEYTGQYFQPNNKGKKYRTEDMSGAEPAGVNAFREWILKKGVSKFKYVPGYFGSTKPATQAAVSKMAWSMYLGRLAKGKVQNKRTQWYAKSTGQILKKARPVIKEAMIKMWQDGEYVQRWSSTGSD